MCGQTIEAGFVFGRTHIFIFVPKCFFSSTNKLQSNRETLTQRTNKQITYTYTLKRIHINISGGYLVLNALFPSLRSYECFLLYFFKSGHFRFHSDIFERIVALNTNACMQWHFDFYSVFFSFADLQSSSIIIINRSPNENQFLSPLQIFTLN